MRAWERLVNESAELARQPLPPAAAEHATRVLADTVGVILGGGRRTEITRLVGGVSPGESWRRDDGSALLVAGGGRAEPDRAAFVNATAGTFLELDEGFRPTGHPAIHVLPAALAVAQSLHATGEQLLRAFVAGYEVTAGLFEAYRLRYPLHPHGHFGAVGAAVAVAALRGVDPLPSARIASTVPVLSTWQPCFEGATARNTYAGHAASAGVTAHRLVEAGFTGSQEALDAAFGELVGEPVEGEGASPPGSQGQPRILRDYLKLHSACALTHAAIDAIQCLQPLNHREVANVQVETVANNLKIARPASPNDLSTRFSLPYAVAATLMYGHARPEAFEYRPPVAELAERVEVRAFSDSEKALEDLWPEAAPTRVTVWLTNGQHREARVDNPLGHYTNPASDAQLADKFAALTGDVVSHTISPAALYSRLRVIANETDVADLPWTEIAP